jgi:phospholipid/cholesterol/gamma-HCH transport system substrate-binding protein
MEPKKHYIAVGTFVIGTFLLLAAFAIWLTGGADRVKYTPYRIFFTESVNGLSEGGPVKFRGVEIGKVRNIALDRENPERVEVLVDIDSNAPIRQNTIATLKSQGITGITFVELEQSALIAPPAIHYGDGIAEIPSVPSNITVIFTSLPEAISRFSNASNQFAKLLNDENVKTTGEMVKNIRDLTGTLQSSTQNLQSVLKRLEQLMGKTNRFADSGYGELYEVLTEIKNTTRDVGSLADTLKKDPSQVIFPSEPKGVRLP